MSVRNLESLFDPGSVAVLGASERPGSLGNIVWRNLSSGGYTGQLFPVNLKRHALGPQHVFAHLRELPLAPDLAVVCTPPASVTRLIEELADLGTRAVLVLSTGLSATQIQGMLQAAQKSLLRIVGPDCMGLLSPHLGLNASLSATSVTPGDLAFVSQSNALVSTMLDWAQTRQIGFSHVTSMGERCDVDMGDMLDYLASDPKTRAILLYANSIDQPKKFMSAARAAARNKPVIMVKAGRYDSDAKAGQGGLDAIVSADRVLDAALGRAGILRVNTLQELFLAAQTLSRFRSNTCDTLTIISNSVNAGLMAADAASHIGVRLSRLSPKTQQAVARLMPSGHCQTKPVWLLKDLPPVQYEEVWKILRDDPAAGAVLLLHAPSAQFDSAELARSLATLARDDAGQVPRLMACWLADSRVQEARSIFQQANIASFDTPEQAVRAFSMLVRYRRNQAELTEAAPASTNDFHPDTATIRALVQQTLACGQSSLSEADALTVLQCAGMSLADHAPLAAAPGDCMTPGSEHPLWIGSQIDPLFGPVIVFGTSAAASDPMGDWALALPPLNIALARALVSRTRVSHLLGGTRELAAANQEALHRVLVAVSQLLADIPEIEELQIRPLIATPEGVSAGQVQIQLCAQAPAGAANFCIRPYPAQLEETVQWQGQTLCLRAIRPEDESLHMAFLQSLEPEDVRMRVFFSKRRVERSELARLVQIDYAREMAFIALTQDADGLPQTLGVVRSMTDPDNQQAEFAVIVRSDLKGNGLGRLLMEKLIRYLRSQGTQRLVADVLKHNERMLKMAAALGFQTDPDAQRSEDIKSIFLTLT